MGAARATSAPNAMGRNISLRKGNCVCAQAIKTSQTCSCFSLVFRAAVCANLRPRQPTMAIMAVASNAKAQASKRATSVCQRTTMANSFRSERVEFRGNKSSSFSPVACAAAAAAMTHCCGGATRACDSLARLECPSAQHLLRAARAQSRRSETFAVALVYIACEFCFALVLDFSPQTKSLSMIRSIDLCDLFQIQASI